MDFARRQGRKNEPRMQENVVFCVFLRLHWFCDLEPKIVVLRPRGNSDLGLQIGPGTREKEIEFERYRISKNASASAAVW